MTGVLKKKKLLGDFLGYLDDIQNQFPLKKTDGNLVSLDTIEGILDALRVRSAYFIYTQIVVKYAQAKSENATTKAL